MVRQLERCAAPSRERAAQLRAACMLESDRARRSPNKIADLLVAERFIVGPRAGEDQTAT